ncbi:hypothetical protein BAE44_0024637 [Dichanthelium oligosanthes]|uniref:Leucine-rich repeat-containing N-terminal plant-type domain-containing protein n=1 Tax=Dichanthelium oligosanthes TaxID=888268 RepID=A0A1E5UN74_9POAL|nr:hypothetical protein BAE44_0024637 [Dichanthelium oligosanthes]
MVELEAAFAVVSLMALLVAALLSTTGTIHAAPTHPHSPPSPLGVPVALDEQALLSFRVLVTGDPHGVLTSWKTGNGTRTNLTSVCSWRGVGCHSRRHPGRVTSLELPPSNLKGTISPFLANLTFLRMLNLSYNSFSGNIPWELGFLHRLLYLDLRHNSLQGVIPLSLNRASKIPANLSNL